MLADFERNKRAVIVELRERPKNQLEWALEHWQSILDKDETFDMNSRLLAAIDSVSRKHLEELYDEILTENLAGFIFIASQDHISTQGFHPAATLIQDYKSFKNRMPSYVYP